MKNALAVIAATVAALSLWHAGGQEPPEVLEVDGTNMPALLLDTNAEPKVVQPAQIELSPALSEVVRLAQSGAEESVIVAYIQKAPPYEIGSDEIIYLQDLGISDAVLKALVEHSQPGADGSRPTIPNSGVATNAPTPPGIEAQAVVPPVVEAPLTPSAPPPATVAEFYEPLSPYGTWIDVAPYGWCWQPNVVVVNRGWHPYADRGHWLWSDAGWYWHSYYSWGWAPFHYGRWFQHPRRGWCWAPDRIWGPSWVSWRNSPDYCGWAPLPPGAHFSAGIGWSFHGRRVGHDFSFGLGFPHFTFVATSHFLDRHVHSRSLHRREAAVVIKNTTVINNYAAGPQNRIVNRGIDRRRIETATGTRVREVSVRELPREPRRASMPDRVTRENGTEVVYRPGPDIRIPRPSVRPGAASLANQSSVPGATRSGRRAPQGRQGEIRGTDAISPTPEVTPGRRNSVQPGINSGARQERPEAPPATGGRRVPQRPQDGTPAPGPIQPRVAPRATPDTPAPPPGRTAPAPGIQRSVPSLPPQTAPRTPSQPGQTAPTTPTPRVTPRVSPPVQPRNVPRRDDRRGGSAGVITPAPRVSPPPGSSGFGNPPAMGRRAPTREMAPASPGQSLRSQGSSGSTMSRRAAPSVAPRSAPSRAIERSAPSQSVPSRADSGRRSRSRD
jgi:hypothetical protein